MTPQVFFPLVSLRALRGFSSVGAPFGLSEIATTPANSAEVFSPLVSLRALRGDVVLGGCR